eukprot:357567-Chlamydomonas_euryale.AAC.1
MSNIQWIPDCYPVWEHSEGWSRWKSKPTSLPGIRTIYAYHGCYMGLCNEASTRLWIVQKARRVGTRQVTGIHVHTAHTFTPMRSSLPTCTFAAPLKRYSAIVAGTGDRSSSRSAVAERTASILGLHVRAPSSWAYAAST